MYRQPSSQFDSCPIMINDVDLIIPRLWLGNFDSSQEFEFIRKYNIDVIINCTKDLPFAPIDGIYKYRIPIDDNLQRDQIISMAQWVGKILPIMFNHYQNGRSILVHCAAGIQHSAIVVLSFLYVYYHQDVQSAVHTINLKTSVCLFK